MWAESSKKMSAVVVTLQEPISIFPMDVFEQWLQQLEQGDPSGLLRRLVYFLFWSIVILLLMWLVRKGINRRVGDNAMRYRAKKTASLTGYILVMLVAVFSFTGKLQYLGITIGLVSAGIAFTMQEVFLSVAGWVAIHSSNMFKPGDRIELNGVRGDVIDISITRTTLMEIGAWSNSDNYSGRIVRLSNAFVFKNPVYNYSTDFPFVWDEIILPVHYGSDVKMATQLLLDSAAKALGDYPAQAQKQWKVMVRKYLIENANVEPTVGVKLTDNWIEFNLRYVTAYEKRRSTKTELFTSILEAVGQTQGKVALASATFEVLEMPEMKVKVQK